MTFLTRRDRILLAVLAGCTAILAIYFYLVPFLRPHRDGRYVTVSVDGQPVGTWPLSEEREEDIDTSFGHNRLVIRDGYAVMTEADCPDGLCMHQGRISEPGEMIVCLPHRVIAEVSDESGEDAGYDSISQ